ncbi:RNA polymerase sigma-70 factor [Paraflavitalea sp. CAU 1676]|uniref:RNA polymerase sigma factor n=1 Tax=Paraflavitalea sp. CAU 1676 TaxID=3032598 RepID=UPI0023DAFD5A|nr:RNA polymerase sigma-70 factor [Paraflavitalea sp. CAU 1676]MDF2188552.1 RNA polymerase sigma-70 factor [Paraflavitalea sp. CAU 1676]
MPVTTTHTDDELLKLMHNDDQQAFTLIYRRHWEKLFVTAAKALRNGSDARDVVQDVFLSLWSRRQSLHIESSLTAYLETSVRYKAIHYIEKNITRRDYLAFLSDVIEDQFPPSPEIQLQVKQVQEAIRDTISRMPPKMREAYQLSRQEHLSHKEIAEKLGISSETVKKHIQHALQMIKTSLGFNKAAVSAMLYYLLS